MLLDLNEGVLRLMYENVEKGRIVREGHLYKKAFATPVCESLVEFIVFSLNAGLTISEVASALKM